MMKTQHSAGLSPFSRDVYCYPYRDSSLYGETVQESMYVSARDQPCKLRERGFQPPHTSLLESSNNSMFYEPGLLSTTCNEGRMNETSQSYTGNGFHNSRSSLTDAIPMDDRTFNSLRSSNNGLYRSLSSRSVDANQLYRESNSLLVPSSSRRNQYSYTSIQSEEKEGYSPSSFLTVTPSLTQPLSFSFGNGLLHILLRLSSYYDMSKCHPQIAVSNVDLNPNAPPDAKLCYDFLNSGKCRREKKHGCCTYRHLPINHIQAIIERIRSGKQNVCIIQQKDGFLLTAEMPGYSHSLPGELNSHAQPTADLCREFSIRGKCSVEAAGGVCPYRHLVACHPERIGFLFQHRKLTDFEVKAWILTPCSDLETNPFSRSTDRPCHDFVTTGICSRFQSGKICRFRHLLPGHPDRK